MHSSCKTLSILLVFLLSFYSAFAQVTLKSGPTPAGGLDAVALTFYKINFTKAQRTALADVDIEFILAINPDGVATVEKVNGLTDQVLLDSLYNAGSQLPKFQPKIVKGERQSSLYFFQMRFPTYDAVIPQGAMQDVIRFNAAAYEDFDTIQVSGQRYDILIGGVANTFLGNASSYLSPGGGMKLEVMYAGKKGFGGGLMMSFYGNKRKKEFPIPSDRAQNSAPPTLLVGAGVTKELFKKERTEVILQFELNMAVQNITPRDGENDKDYTQFNGFSPGLVGHYLLKLGKPKTNYYYGMPSLYYNYLNFHAAVRPMFLDLKEASGVMLERRDFL
jgi:hypothetical protein